MHEVSFLQDLAVVMIAAGIVTVLFQRLKQPVVLGYIVAGILIGPHLFKLVSGEDAIKSLAELGMVFLMISLGLEFNCLLYTSPSPRDGLLSRMPSSA